MLHPPYKLVDEGVLLFVLVTPKASLDEIAGLFVSDEEAGGQKVFIRARVRAIADKGLANKAVIKLIADWLGIAKSSVELRSGAKARQKTLLVNVTDRGDRGALKEELMKAIDQRLEELKL